VYLNSAPFYLISYSFHSASYFSLVNLKVLTSYSLKFLYLVKIVIV
jgi:hypothetical protein